MKSIKKKKVVPNKKTFVREFIRYHPEIIKIKNDLYRIKKNGKEKRKIVGLMFQEGDIYLQLEGVKEREMFSKEKIYKAINNKKIQLKGSVSFKNKTYSR